MINNPISVEVDLLRIQQLALPHAAGAEEGVLVQPDAVLVQPAPLGPREEGAHPLLGLLEFFYAEGTGELVVRLALEALVGGLLAVDLF